MNIIENAKAHLGAALAQQAPSDDQIIMDHVKAAYELLGALGPHIHQGGGADPDQCGLCGLDIRDKIHVRSDPRPPESWHYPSADESKRRDGERDRYGNLPTTE